MRNKRRKIRAGCFFIVVDLGFDDEAETKVEVAVRRYRLTGWLAGCSVQ